jgi:hypothetical protein
MQLQSKGSKSTHRRAFGDHHQYCTRRAVSHESSQRSQMDDHVRHSEHPRSLTNTGRRIKQGTANPEAKHSAVASHWYQAAVSLQILRRTSRWSTLAVECPRGPCVGAQLKQQEFNRRSHGRSRCSEQIGVACIRSVVDVANLPRAEESKKKRKEKSDQARVLVQSSSRSCNTSWSEGAGFWALEMPCPVSETASSCMFKAQDHVQQGECR